MAEATEPLPPARRGLVTLVVMGGTLMVVLDTTIANVALPHMKAALSATQDSISWVLTSYIVATAVVTPIIGWLTDRVGRRQLFTLAIVGFTLSSMMCGASNSLIMMVVARLLQGVFGAFIVPLSQTIIYAINPPEKHAQAMAIWSMGTMVGPLVGPTLGGWLTDSWTWRWCFFVNVPVGIVSMIGSWLLLPDNERKRRRFDKLGFTLLAIGLFAMQMMLDRGTDRDWFHSTEIIIETAVMVAFLWMFGVHLATNRDTAIVPLALFRNANYVSALVLITVVGGLITAGAALISPMMQGLMGYPVMLAGEMTLPRGAGMIVTMQISSRLVGKVDTRLMMGLGLAITAASLHTMTGLSPDMDSRLFLTAGFLQGVGMGMVVMPMNLLAFSSIDPSQQTEGAAFYNLIRSLGGSISISITSALLAHNIQQSHADLTAGLDPTIQHFLSMAQLQDLGATGAMIPAFIDQLINQQASFIAYIDDYYVMMWAVIAVIPLVLILRPSKRNKADIASVDMGH